MLNRSSSLLLITIIIQRIAQDGSKRDMLFSSTIICLHSKSRFRLNFVFT